MPTRALKYCARGDCPAKVPSGYCQAHQREINVKRGSATDRGYGSRWDRYSQRWRQKFPVCGMRQDGELYGEHSRCAASGRSVAAQAVDHIQPHRGDRKLMWDPANLQSLCLSCHATKTVREDGGFGNRRAGSVNRIACN